MASEFKIFMRNAIKFLTFGFKMYESGVCDQPIDGSFKFVNPSEEYGYTKKEAANILNLSVRQFDRLIRKGEIRNGRKIRGFTTLFWDKSYIDKLSSQQGL